MEKISNPLGFAADIPRSRPGDIIDDRKQDKSRTAEERSLDALLLGEARNYLLANSDIRGALGDAITVGEVYSRSYSSTMENGRSSFRVQMSFLVEGSLGRAEGTLSGNQDGITLLDVDVDGLGIINVL